MNFQIMIPNAVHVMADTCEDRCVVEQGDGVEFGRRYDLKCDNVFIDHVICQPGRFDQGVGCILAEEQGPEGEEPCAA